MIQRDQIIDFIHHQAISEDLLKKAQTLDTRANGVQIHGSQKVDKIVLGVSANLDFLKEAVSSQAQFCIFHHGINLGDSDIYNSRLNQATQKQLSYIFQHNLTIAGYHYSLDAHPKIGNNAVIIEKLGAIKTDESYFDGWGWIGEFKIPQDVTKLAKKCSELFEHDIFAVYSGPKKIKRIGVCSGSARPRGGEVLEIFENNIDLHISGEINESGPALAKESGFNYFSCGHYATEVFGVQALGRKIKEHFKANVEVEFIDIPNPL
jgi:dinuclear metal center YbgI/SA1388 family protein